MGFRTVQPAPNTGYNRLSDWPTAGGVAAGASVNGQPPGGLVNYLKGEAAPGSPGQWHPTIAWMLGFVVVEMVLFGFLSRQLHL